MARDTQITWASVVPLIGGMPLAHQHELGYPQWVASYPGFWANDHHYIEYLRNVKGYPVEYVELEKHSNHNPMPDVLKHVDITCAVPPCAGLSMLNSSTSGDKGRGSDAVQNDCMFYTTEWTLHNIKPKVHWGENAPGLWSNIGEGVREKLTRVAERYGYSLLFLRTNSNLHGLPQNRPRTFYFFFKGDSIPVFNYVHHEMPSIRNFIDDIPDSLPNYDQYITSHKPTDFMPYVFLMEEFGNTHQEMADIFEGTGTVLGYIISEGLLDTLIDWLKANHPEATLRPKGKTYYEQMVYIKGKLDRGLGFWDGSPIFYKDQVNAVISKNVFGMMHHREDRFFNIREYMELMGLPRDFTLDKVSNFNHVCQNVPVQSALTWVRQLKADMLKKKRLTRVKKQVGYFDNVKKDTDLYDSVQLSFL